MLSYTLGLALIPAFASAYIHNIKVGAGGLTFDPPAIGAQIGDQVVFHFQQKNHSLVQSSLDSPCGPKEGGINSGFFPVPANQTDHFPTFAMTIENTDPFWAYCSQAARTPNSHCGAGMVFSVNCGPDGAPNSFENFRNSALEIGKQLKAEGEVQAPPAEETPAGGYGGGGYGGGGYGGGGYGGGEDKPAEGSHEPAAGEQAPVEGAGYTIAPEPTGTVRTEVVSVETATWTTTYSSYPGSAAPTPGSIEGSIINVDVGKDGLTFSPSQVQAKPRDKIVFTFYAKNHTVTQSLYSDPCVKLDGVVDGLDSGFMAVAPGTTEGNPTYEYIVKDTNPVWAYCAQPTGNHCGAGMVFALNSVETSDRNFAAFQTIAEAKSANSGIDANTTTPATGAAEPEGAATSHHLSGFGFAVAAIAVVVSLF